MIIERYSEKYREDIAGLVQDFQDYSLTEYGLTFNSAVLSKTIDELKEQSFLLIVDGRCEGLLAGKEVKTPISTDRVWQEVIWYVSPDYRGVGVFMLQKAKKILKDEGFTSIAMVVMHNSKTKKLFRYYEGLGLKPTETHWIGRL